MDEQPIYSRSEEDLKLWDAIRKQDKKVFESFYKKYCKQLFALAYQYVNQMQIAEEIVHDVFITIWNKGDKLNVQYSMKSYLFKSVVNSSLNYLKKEKSLAEKQIAYLASQDGEAVSVEDNEEEEALLKKLEEALSLLPEKCKQVMYLSRFGKLKQQEIADQMDISIKTVKNHLTYGFQKIRAHLDIQKQVIIIFLLILLTINGR
ncbi:RNA polymerase sigma factor [Pedobacter sp. MC2016-24]|uniref:RNA polymerase sigma factor n=1 Tax=Pedobacter sp. MC2016-24 TaxID=2780090 RepID=UPI001880B30C|nr:RNA polymerase sigma-70 factor [Pedobacter sp. MC2016-24]MBE9597926.1 RNA polymerase sigma-70 factor [Pedobacter sp. MC2016-24]